MKRRSRILAVLMAALLVTAMPLSVLAEEYNLADGSITVNASESGQTVTQEAKGINNQEQTTPTVIKSQDSSGNNTSTPNTVTISSSGDATAKVTLDNVNISTDNSNAINVTENSKAEITVSGENSVSNASNGQAVINVGENAELTIQGESGTADKLNVTANGILPSNEPKGAVIGSNYGEDFTGSVNVSDVTLAVTNAGRGQGAGIGSGAGGAFTGSVQISGSDVTVDSDYSVGIGSGDEGAFSGEVTIQDSQVKITSGEASIGGGNRSSFDEDGLVTIDNSTVIADSDKVAIGADKAFNGKVTITGDSTIQTNNPIGSFSSTGNGTVSVGPDAKLYSSDGQTQKSWADVIQGAEAEIAAAPSSASAVPAEAAEAATAAPATFNEDDFWNDVIARIRAAKKGDTLTIDAGGFTTMPRAVMEALAECGVTLVIHWMGGEDIVIDNPITDGNIWVFSFYTLPDLLAK